MKYRYRFDPFRRLVLFSTVTAVLFLIPFQHPNAQSDRRAELVEKLSEFNDWAVTARRDRATGEKLAEGRLQAFRELSILDPRSAIDSSISVDAYGSLPDDLKMAVEQPVSAYGDLLVYAIDDAHGERIERYVSIDGNVYKAIVFGRRQALTTKFGIPIKGFIVGDTIVVDEDIYEKSVASDDGLTVKLGGTVVAFQSQSELDDFTRDQIEFESTIGPTRSDAAKTSLDSPQSSWTEGVKKVLFIRVDFSDVPGEPVDGLGQTLTLASAQSVLNTQVSQFYLANSYGKTSMLGTATTVVRMPQTRLYYMQGGYWNTLLSDARTVARNAGFDTNNFDLDVVGFTYSQYIPWLGIGSVGGKGALLNGSFSLGTVAHELGHSYGLLHANTWETTDGSVIGPGYNYEYGDPFDTMGLGAGYGPGAHFNAKYKRLLDWLTDSNIQTVTTSGIYRIVTADSPVPGGIRVLKIKKNNSKNYWIEFRQLLGGNSSNGASVRWDYSSQSFRETQLLDMTPATLGDPFDAPLKIGQTFTDSENGITLTTIGKGGTSPESLDIQVQFAGSPSPTPSPTPTATPTPSPMPTPPQGNRTLFDFDGDGRSDITVFRPSDNTWYLSLSQDGYKTRNFGVAGDQVTPADFDGDGKTDIAVWRPSDGYWYVINSGLGTFTAIPWGVAGDMPVPADFDGDNKADLAVFRPSNGTWYRILSRDGYSYATFGQTGDKPLMGDFDGDSKDDLAVYRDGMWYLYMTTDGYRSYPWGIAGDVPVPADYNGDGRTDLAIYRPSTGEWWTYRPETFTVTQTVWGNSTDIPVAADYDGDGKFDKAVFRPTTGTWWFYRTRDGITSQTFGSAGDTPLPNTLIK